MREGLLVNEGASCDPATGPQGRSHSVHERCAEDNERHGAGSGFPCFNGFFTAALETNDARLYIKYLLLAW